MSRRVLVVLPTRSYRAAAFLSAARRLGLEVVVASEEASTLAGVGEVEELVVDLNQPDAAADAALTLAGRVGLDAVVAVDDGAVQAAAAIALKLGLRGNPVDAVAATRDKLRLRQSLARSGFEQQSWWPWTQAEEPEEVRYPAVVKPLDQAASRGVIRVEDRRSLRRAGSRIRAQLGADPGCQSLPHPIPLLVEEFVPGPEVALEGVLLDGRLLTLAVYDKPEPLDGPYFEETIYTVPSELAAQQLGAARRCVEEAVRALGLLQGAVHAEVRLGGPVPRLVDIASRSIGGRCSKVLRFRTQRSLEEILLLAALGQELGDLELTEGTRGVMMMPIPAAGILRSVQGRDEVLRWEGIEAVELAVPIGSRVVPLPEGDRYLGFIFASGEGRAQVAAKLRRAYEALQVVIAA